MHSRGDPDSELAFNVKNEYYVSSGRSGIPGKLQNAMNVGGKSPS